MIISVGLVINFSALVFQNIQTVTHLNSTISVKWNTVHSVNLEDECITNDALPKKHSEKLTSLPTPKNSPLPSTSDEKPYEIESTISNNNIQEAKPTFEKYFKSYPKEQENHPLTENLDENLHELQDAEYLNETLIKQESNDIAKVSKTKKRSSQIQEEILHTYGVSAPGLDIILKRRTIFFTNGKSMFYGSHPHYPSPWVLFSQTKGTSARSRPVPSLLLPCLIPAHHL